MKYNLVEFGERENTLHQTNSLLIFILLKIRLKIFKKDYEVIK